MESSELRKRLTQLISQPSDSTMPDALFEFVRAYAEAAVKAERAACEETCANLWDLRDDERAKMYAAKCATAIRARGE